MLCLKKILDYFLDFFNLIRVNEYISVKNSSTIITNVLGNDFKNPQFFFLPLDLFNSLLNKINNIYLLKKIHLNLNISF